MTTYVLMLSKVFPAKHPRQGEPTNFLVMLDNVRFLQKEHRMPIQSMPGIKCHTIRANYPLWAKRFEKIERGEACLSIRQWAGKPYASEQVEIKRLTHEDGIGIQKMEILKYQDGYRSDTDAIWIDGNVFHNYRERIAYKDGLTLEDWEAWFKDYDLTQPLAIIHFTKFRYNL